jgi:PKD repeat protein
MVTLLLLACTGAPDVTPTEEAPKPTPVAELAGDAVVFVVEDAPFDVGGSVGGLYTWDFGDGETAIGEAVTHAYAAPGRYTIRLTAAWSDGRTDTATATRVAVYEPLATPPTASSALAYLDGALYAVLPDSDEVVVVADNAVVDRLAVCGHPVAVSAGAGRLAVACRDDAVQFWDLATNTLLSEVGFRWGARPVAVAGNYVALAGTGELVHMSGTDIYVTATLPDPGAVATGEGLAAEGATAFYATRFRSPAEGGVVHYEEDTDGGLLDREYLLAPDPGPDSDTDARGLPTLLGAIALSPDGRTLVVAGAKANMDRGLQRDGLALTHETSTRASLRVLDTHTGGQLLRDHFDNRDRVGAVAFTPLGDQLLVAHHGAGIVDILDPFTLTRIGGFQSVGVGLDGIATDGETAWVLSSLTRELVAYQLGTTDEIELARVSLVGTEPLDAELLLGAQVFHAASDPRMATDAYVSCASCHPDGGGDARTWDFTDRGEGFRDTQALFAMPANGPLHWSANFDEVQDFENAIRAHQAGAGFLADDVFATVEDPLGDPKAGLSAELDALAAYVHSFSANVPRSPWRNTDGSQTDAGLRGRAVFVAEGCDTCHAGAELTDAGWDGDTPILHDVGTLLPTSGDRAGGPLTGLRTPSLRGLHATAPYLHDGRAPTLAEALTAHGVTLGEADTADLVAYLLELEGSP